MGFNSEDWQKQMQAIAQSLRELAREYKGDAQILLCLLRELEVIHQEIRDGLFQEALPNNRQDLYNFLKDMESEGGWPYLGRMKLRSLLVNLESECEVDSNSATAAPTVNSSAETQV